MRRPRSRSGRRSRAAWAMAADAAASDGAAERAAAELEGFVMKGTSGERERAEPPGALSRPDRLKPVPAGLSLSSRRWAARLASGPKPRGQCTARRFSYRSWGRSEGEIIRLDGPASGQSLKIGTRPDRPLDSRYRPFADLPGWFPVRKDAPETTVRAGAAVGGQPGSTRLVSFPGSNFGRRRENKRGFADPRELNRTKIGSCQHRVNGVFVVECVDLVGKRIRWALSPRRKPRTSRAPGRRTRRISLRHAAGSLQK